MIELKPCPFCGGEAEWAYLVPDGAIIGCKDAYSANPKCRIKPEIRRYRGSKEKSLEIAISDWNTRPSDWHNGIPTEEGWYQIAIRFGNRIEYESRKCRRTVDNNGNECMRFDGCNPVVAWQKIEPYKEKEDGIQTGL